VNPVRLRHGPAVGMGLVAIAGPISNLLLATLAAIGYHATSLLNVLSPTLFLFFVTFIQVNIFLALFNLIPIFPLDGFRVSLALLRLARGRTALDIAYRLESTAAYGPTLFILLIVGSQVLRIDLIGPIIGTPTIWLVRLLLGSQ